MPTVTAARRTSIATATPLVFERLGRRFRRNRPWALRDVSLEIPEGSITALVGANGAGKSTLIRACLGFERPNEGRVLVFGLDPRRDRAAVVGSIGYVPQATALYRGLTIDDHFVMAKAARPAFDTGFARAHVERVGLAMHRRVGELSGGEQAQVTLALALAGRAPLLLLDEPLASLDPLARRDFLTALLADVRGRGATAVLSSHIVTDVEQACDRLVVLADGQLVLADAVAAARDRYRIVVGDALDGGTVIGRFAGPDGGLLALVDGGTGRPATLEEVVLGHLAARRSAPTLAA
jgi:ABC-2 type transport system ATP-binding protein